MIDELLYIGKYIDTSLPLLTLQIVHYVKNTGYHQDIFTHSLFTYAKKRK